MTIIAELTEEQVFEAVVAYAQAMLPPGWFKYTGLLKRNIGEGVGYVVSFEPIPVSERPKPPPEVSSPPPPPGEVHEVSEVSKILDRPSSLPPVGGFTNNGVMVRV